jgi:hypothetical protein
MGENSYEVRRSHRIVLSDNTVLIILIILIAVTREVLLKMIG